MATRWRSWDELSQGETKTRATSFERSHAHTSVRRAPIPAAGHRQPTPLPETPGQSRASLGQALVGSLLLPLGPGAHKFLFVPSQSLFPSPVYVLEALWRVNGDLLQEGFCHAQVDCTQSPCPCSSPLPTRTSSGDTQTQFCLSLCGVSGSWCSQSSFEPSEHLWRVWGLILNVVSPPYHLAGAFALPLDEGYLLTDAPASCSHRTTSWVSKDQQDTMTAFLFVC